MVRMEKTHYTLRELRGELGKRGVTATINHAAFSEKFASSWGRKMLGEKVGLLKRVFDKAVADQRLAEIGKIMETHSQVFENVTGKAAKLNLKVVRIGGFAFAEKSKLMKLGMFVGPTDAVAPGSEKTIDDLLRAYELEFGGRTTGRGTKDYVNALMNYQPEELRNAWRAVGTHEKYADKKIKLLVAAHDELMKRKKP